MTETRFVPNPEAARVNPAGIIAIILAATILIGRHSVLAAALAMIVAFAVVLVLSRRLRNASVTVTDDRLTYVGLLGPAHIARADISEIVLVPELKEAGPKRTSSLLLLGAAGRRLLRLDAPLWDLLTTQAVADSLGGATWSPPGPVSNRDLALRYPQAIPAALRNPNIYAFILMGGVFGLIVLVALIYGFVLD